MTKITCTINNVEEGDIIQDYAPTDIRNKNGLKYLMRQIIGINVPANRLILKVIGDHVNTVFEVSDLHLFHKLT